VRSLCASLLIITSLPRGGAHLDSEIYPNDPKGTPIIIGEILKIVNMQADSP